MRRAAKVDANQAAIVAEFERLGCAVVSLAGCAGGVPDLLIAVPGRPPVSFLVEVKDGGKSPSRRVLTPLQRIFHDTWAGHIDVVERVEDVAESIRVAVRGVG